MTTLTLDQLSYVLERKYKNIRIGSDVIISCTVTLAPDGRQYIYNSDAAIVEWRITNIGQPTDELIHDLWNKLQEQYNSNPYRVDSELYKIINPDTPLDAVEEVAL